ncbi:MAG: phage tail protein [Oscillibacter sp.]
MAEGSVITEKGRALLGKILATQTPLVISYAMIGSGDLPSGKTPASMTNLANSVMEASIAAMTNPAAGEVKVLLQVLSTDVTTAFIAKEVGIWATDPDEGDILYCYVPMQSDPVQMRAAGDVVGKMLTLEISLIVSNAASVTANISPTALVRRSELAAYALVTHGHVIADITGLQDILTQYQNSIDLLNDLMSGDMPGGITFAMDFAALSNVTVTDGVWNASGQYLTA